MSNSFESDIKYVNINPCHLNKKRRDKKAQNGGYIKNHQKKKKN